MDKIELVNASIMNLEDLSNSSKKCLCAIVNGVISNESVTVKYLEKTSGLSSPILMLSIERLCDSGYISLDKELISLIESKCLFLEFLADDSEVNSINDSRDDSFINVFFYYQKTDVDAIGYENNDGSFTVKRSSKVSFVKKITCTPVIARLREKYSSLIDDKGCLLEDITFKSANEATCFCLYGAGSATKLWVTGEGVSLHDYRLENYKCPAVSFEEAVEAKPAFVVEEKTQDKVEILAQSDMSYSERYHLNSYDYSRVMISDLGFSYRSSKRLLDHGIDTVEKLLFQTDSKLKRINGFGISCFNEIHKYLTAVSSGDDSSVQVIGTPAASLLQYKEQLMWGDFSFLENAHLDARSMEYVMQFKEAHEIIDFPLLEEIINGTPAIFQLEKTLRDFIYDVNCKKEMRRIVSSISEEKLNKKVTLLIDAYSDDNDITDSLKGYVSFDVQSLQEYIESNIEKYINGEHVIVDFIEWCKFNLKDEIVRFFKDIIKNERYEFVIEKRAETKTLEEVGKLIDTTRERVRQIEVKVRDKFDFWQRRNRIINKLFLELNESSSLSTTEILSYVGDYGNSLVYLFKLIEPIGFMYDKDLDMFILEDLSFKDKVNEYVDSLPDVFHEKYFSSYVSDANMYHSLPEKVVAATIEDKYKKTGDTYHRFRLNLTNLYSDIFSRFYPKGMHIYDSNEITVFREHVYQEYGIDISDKNDRSIASILGRVGILCGRGIYRYRSDETTISDELASKIYQYIQNSDAPVFLFNTIFSSFEEELLEEGVDNKYYLQGILRDLFEEKLIFRKDYVSKDESYLNISTSIYDLIKNSKYPVTKDAIKEKYPGITEIVIALSVSDENIINLFGQYLHADQLKIGDSDVDYLRNLLEKYLVEKRVCHCRDIFEYIMNDYPSLLKNNFIEYPFGFFSLVEYLFRENYYYSRPYIAVDSNAVEGVDNLLFNTIQESEIVEIDEVQSFAKEHHIAIYSILDFINSCNSTHLLINESEMATLEYVGITDDIAKLVEQIILEEVSATVPIHSIKSLYKLPSINVNWTAWLIYSVLKKWSSKLDVGTSSHQFKRSFPIVAPVGCLDSNNVNNDDSNGEIAVADDLSNIDDLIGEMIVDDLEGIDEL